MISGFNYKNKILRQKSLNEKIEQKSEKEVISMKDSGVSQKGKVKTRMEREKPVTKEQIKKLGIVRQNDIKRESSSMQSSEMFSRTNARVKISIKSSKQYFSKVNSNGFSRCPPPFTQILPPILIILFIAQILVLSVHFMANYQTYIIVSVMAFLIIPACYFWYLTTSISSTDSIQLQHLHYIEDPHVSTFQPQKHKYFCTLCKTCISHKSFHCNKCNRCVEYFDHHCKWLNNCIGARNYVEFIQLVVWSQLFMLFFYVVNAMVVVQICRQEEHLPVLLWVAIATLVVSLVPFVAISMLLFLHLYLIIAKRTTIQLIMENRRKNKIHPQALGDSLTEKRDNGYKVDNVLDESPINSPSFFQKQHSVLKDQSNQSLKKFVTNLSNNLRLSKKTFKDIQLTIDSCADNKISFKPAILKKSTSFGGVDFKANSVNQQMDEKSEFEQEKSEVGSKNRAKINSDNEDFNNEYNTHQDFQTTGKNLMTKLRFSTKKQFFDQEPQVKTSRQSQKHARSQTQRFVYDQKRKINVKEREPSLKNQTERRIRFNTKIQTFDKENVPVERDMPNLDFEKGECEGNDQGKKADEFIEKPKSTRLFQVVSSANNYDQEN